MRIGLSSCFFHADPKRPIFKGKTLVYAEQSMARWVASGGALVYLIPAGGGESASYARDLDGLVLQGGSDVSPESYGEAAMRPEWAGDRARDLHEIDLIRAFLAADKPVLGICRGAQILNVAQGGSLFQDIETQCKGARRHRDWEIYDQNVHEVLFAPKSALEGWHGQAGGKVTSIHHQGIKELGAGIRVEAVSEGDEVIEALKFEGARFAYGVQWHPEFHPDLGTAGGLLDGAPMLQAFLDAAKGTRR